MRLPSWMPTVPGTLLTGRLPFDETRLQATPLVRGTVVPIDFTPGYVGRRGNTTGSAPEAWVASDHPVGDALPWRVGEPGSTFPAEAAGWLLDHLGHPNFGAPELPGIVLDAGDGEVQVSEEGAVGSYRLWLNKPPVGMLRVRIECPDPLEASLDGGLSFHPELGSPWSTRIRSRSSFAPAMTGSWTPPRITGSSGTGSWPRTIRSRIRPTRFYRGFEWRSGRMTGWFSPRSTSTLPARTMRALSLWNCAANPASA